MNDVVCILTQCAAYTYSDLVLENKEEENGEWRSSHKFSPAAVVHKAKSTADRDVYCLCW